MSSITFYIRTLIHLSLFHNTTMKNWLVLIPIVSCLLSSCSTSNNNYDNITESSLSKPLKETLLLTTPLKDNPIFLDFGGQTKSRGNDIVPFLDILDTLSITITKERNYLVTQIPFKSTLDYNEVIVSDSLNIDEYSWSLCRKFFVSLENMTNGEKRFEIVTMIPRPAILEAYGPHSFDYINRELFDGFIIHSDLEGNQIFVTYSSCGPVHNGKLSYNLGSDDANMWIIIPNMVQTKGSDDVITPSICIAFIDSDDTGPHEANPIFFDQGNPADDPNRGSGGLPEDGGGGGGTPFDPYLYSVNVSIIGSGEVDGTGAYSKNYNATIKAKGKMGSHFVRWAGDFFGRDTCFVYVVSKDVFSTALFQQETSCYDSETNINSVINSTTLAATSNTNAENGIYTGADFGWTRDSGTKFHRGVDIAAIEGTPVFAPSDGVITKIVSDIEDGGYDENTCSYDKSSWNAGNRIWLKCSINGNDVTFKYFHLRSPGHGGGIATGLSVGSTVIGGQLIGYSGETGNAQGVDIKHLHLETWVNGSAEDPWSYINGEKDIDNGIISNVNCDRTYIQNPDDNYAQLLYTLPGLINDK